MKIPISSSSLTAAPPSTLTVFTRHHSPTIRPHTVYESLINLFQVNSHLTVWAERKEEALPEIGQIVCIVGILYRGWRMAQQPKIAVWLDGLWCCRLVCLVNNLRSLPDPQILLPLLGRLQSHSVGLQIVDTVVGGNLSLFMLLLFHMLLIYKIWWWYVPTICK